MANSTDTTNPTIVLVHGAFADASSWNGVIEKLQGRGYTTVAPPNPLRGATADSAYIAGVVDQIKGPVLLVGHSYAGAVITNAGTMAKNVVGLVYVSALITDEGETVNDVGGKSKDSILGPALIQRNYPTGEGVETGVEFTIKPTELRAVFAADLPQKQTDLMAATQRPIADRAFSDVNGPPAWKNLRSWAVVATEDKAAGTDVVRSVAQRAGAQIIELEGSHVVMISRPTEVADVILKAATEVTK